MVKPAIHRHFNADKFDSKDTRSQSTTAWGQELEGPESLNLADRPV